MTTIVINSSVRNLHVQEVLHSWNTSPGVAGHFVQNVNTKQQRKSKKNSSLAKVSTAAFFCLTTVKFPHSSSFYFLDVDLLDHDSLSWDFITLYLSRQAKRIVWNMLKLTSCQFTGLFESHAHPVTIADKHGHRYQLRQSYIQELRRGYNHC